MLNTIILLGRLCKEPELRKVSETSLANFDLAVDNPFTDRMEKEELHSSQSDVSETLQRMFVNTSTKVQKLQSLVQLFKETSSDKMVQKVQHMKSLQTLLNS